MTIAQPRDDGPALRLFINWQAITDMVFEAMDQDFAQLYVRVDVAPASTRLQEAKYLEAF